MDRLIALFMTSRSGSSMTAQIFAEHGLIHKGNENYEHQGIKRWIKDRYNKDSLHPKPLPYLKGFREYIEKQEIELWKGDVLNYPLFEFFNPKSVFIKRSIESIINSLQAKNHNAKKTDPKAIQKAIEWRYNYMDQIQQVHGGVTVYTDDLIKRDYTSLKQAFDYCEIPFDKRIADRVIDPEQWHF